MKLHYSKYIKLMALQGRGRLGLSLRKQQKEKKWVENFKMKR